MPMSAVFQSLIKGSQTRLSPYDEMQYQKWVQDQPVTSMQLKPSMMLPSQPVNDPTYDMRGFYQAQQLGLANTSVNPYNNTVHYSDGYTDPFTGQYQSFKSGNNPEKYWEMIPENMYDDPNVIKNARKLGVY